ncbi:solute:sodium symporter family transporter [Roseimaritima sediminicola]|uniref:solute:sodium symporter family transporter n=1 Tax=Roseimaritima sediminicola TaxID=2662066 RepID=UPI001298501C|nr:solute:sodium symporter family transporter [Roseimaritima sediminicola]
MNALITIGSFVFFTALVAVLTWLLTRRTKLDTDEGYFLAGRSLTGVFIAGSLLLTNLSTEQLVGLNGGSFNDGLSAMCWEVIAGISLVILALVFLPRYLKSGIATIPQFLEERYGPTVRATTAMIFIIAYMLILLPFVLFLGANGLNGMLRLDARLGLTELQTIWLVIVAVAGLGGAYAIFGGLRAIAVSDTFNGAGLLIGGLMITYFSLSLIAGEEGGFAAAFEKIDAADPDAFRSLGAANEDTHWPTLFTGVLLLNFFYWCTNQQIIQRTFGAKNLAEGQKGVLMAAFFKILAPLILVLPGITAAYLVMGAEDPQMIESVGQDEEGNWVSSRAYGALVARVLPEWLLGFFAAVVVGSILSTFNSVLNSAATLFSLDVFKKYLHPAASDHQTVRSGQLCSLVIGVLAIIVAPLIFYGREGVFDFFQTLNGVYFIPLLAIIMVGMFNRYVDGRAALITLLIGLGLMILGTFFGGGPEGWLQSTFGSGFHYMGAVFVVLIVLQLALGAAGLRRQEPYTQRDVQAVDLTPWKAAPLVGGLLAAFAISIFVFFAGSLPWS